MKKLILDLFSKDKNLFSFIFISGLILRSITAFFFGDRILENEWNILVKNLYFYDSFSLLVFDDLFVPNLWMPPLYAYYIYFFSIFSSEEAKITFGSDTSVVGNASRISQYSGGKLSAESVQKTNKILSDMKLF